MTPTESFVEIAGGKIQMFKGGSGRPLVVLHHDIGNPGWLPFYDELARDFTVHVPSHPGFGKSDRPEWMRSVRDLAMVYQWLLDELKLGPVAIVGLGFGGWIAAEMAMMCHHGVSHLVLANPMGFLPKNGEILDQFLINTIDYVRSGFENQDCNVARYSAEPTLDQLEQWEINREMTSRIAYKPYMYDQTLPYLIGGVSAPTLIVWGAQNRIVPAVCGEQYRQAIKGARLETIAGAGHFIEMEKPAELAGLVTGFVAR
ncbi:MAG TPA: alpha/beta hydrolase [Candidatus Binataceae bacterium]|nr:alpha/beta hydrolase [Candidatus Binataceae bacterium]